MDYEALYIYCMSVTTWGRYLANKQRGIPEEKLKWCGMHRSTAETKSASLLHFKIWLKESFQKHQGGREKDETAPLHPPPRKIQKRSQFVQKEPT